MESVGIRRPSWCCGTAQLNAASLLCGMRIDTDGIIMSEAASLARSSVNAPRLFYCWKAQWRGQDELRLGSDSLIGVGLRSRLLGGDQTVRGRLRVTQPNKSMASLPTATGLVVNVISGFFLYLYSKTQDRSLYYYQQLAAMQKFSMAMRCFPPSRPPKRSITRRFVAGSFTQGHVNYTGGRVRSGPRTTRQFQSPVNKPTRSTTLLLAPIMRAQMLRNSSGISAVVILRYDSHAI
jgi:hypothetical protein